MRWWIGGLGSGTKGDGDQGERLVLDLLLGRCKMLAAFGVNRGYGLEKVRD